MPPPQPAAPASEPAPPAAPAPEPAAAEPVPAPTAHPPGPPSPVEAPAEPAPAAQADEWPTTATPPQPQPQAEAEPRPEGARPSAPGGADEEAGGSVDGPGRPPRDDGGRLRPPASSGAPQGVPPASPQGAPEQADAPAGTAAGNNLSLVDVRRLWPDIVDATKLKRRVTWIHLTQHAQVVAVDATTLTLGFGNAGARESFVNGGSPEIVRQAAIDVVGADWKVDAIVDPSARADVPAPAKASRPADPPAEDDAPPAPESTPPAPTATASAEVVSAARGAIAPTRSGGDPAPESGDRKRADADVDRDDPDIDPSGLAGAELLQRELGAQIIHEIKHD